jgi:hypothetical protein
MMVCLMHDYPCCCCCCCCCRNLYGHPQLCDGFYGSGQYRSIPELLMYISDCECTAQSQHLRPCQQCRMCS